MNSLTDKKISIITACKNRVDALKISLMSWLNYEEIHEVIITDWDSGEPIDYLTNLDPRIKVIRVENQKYFNQPQPLNIAAKLATGDYILKLDADHLFNPYYNGLSEYFPDEKSFFCGQLDVNYEKFSELEQRSYIDTTMPTNDYIEYVRAYSPFVRYLVGILFVKKEYFDSIGGYNENLGDCYAFEDDEIYQRLVLYGLEKKKYNVNHSYFIHLPHQDFKRIENFKGFDCQENYKNEILNKLSTLGYSGEELKWQTEYALSEQHVKENKKLIGEVKNYFVAPKTKWKISKIDDQNFSASKVNELKKSNPLHNFPSVRCISLEECEERRKLISKEFKKYNINPKFIISKRYSESNDKIIGKYVHTLNDGTKGCCVSHLKMIKDWYDTTNEQYGFFCEDDLSLETVDYWDFTWDEFIKNSPKNFECLQLLAIRQDFSDLNLRERYWDDWGATAYILSRSAAKKIIDNYINDDTFILEIKDYEIMPLIENIIFASVIRTYTVPLFIENTKFNSTFVNKDLDVNDGHKNNHKIASDKVLKLWKNKNKIEQFEVREIVEKTELENLLEKYSLDTENPEHNFNLGVWYENQGHTAPALSYFLRCAERAETSNPTLAYEALIRGSYCYFKQGTRDGSGRGMLWQAQVFLPDRPEAYFLLARYAEKQEWWQDCYSTSHLALINCNFDLPPLRTDVEYPGKYGILFEKAISGWWWGKVEESRSLLCEILNDYELDDEDFEVVSNNLKKMGIEEIKRNKKVDFSYPENFNWSTLTYEDIITIEREVVHEKVYRFWKDVNENDVVLDIGASVGAYTISILDQKPKKVYCVEPSEKLLKVLSENCSQKVSSYSQNPLVYLNYGIVNDENDEINIFGEDPDFIPITFKNLIEKHSIDYINYMKVDCEGGEYAIFKDENIDFLKNNVDFISIEIHLNYEGCREKFKKFRDNYLIKFNNYKVMSCTRQNISWGNVVDLKENIFDDNFIDNYTCEFMIYINNGGKIK